MPIIYLALGTNLGERQQNLRDAIGLLPPQVIVTAASSMYETKAAYVENQPDFLNMAIQAETELPPLPLLTYLKTLEIELGRQKTFRYGPRHLDLDILFYADQSFNEPTLQIPHPRLAERAFVLYPLLEIAPHFKHPLLQLTIQELVNHLPHETPLQPCGTLPAELFS